ncbi:hypothetical protein Tco_0388742 [Tanacetum coccineum]
MLKTLTPELLAGPTFELMKGNMQALDELDIYFCEEALQSNNRKIGLGPTRRALISHDAEALRISHWGKKRRQFYAFSTTRESARDVYSKRRIIAVTKVDRVEWQNYKHLDWITVRRDDNILYKFKEGDFHRLRIQAIEDMLLLLVQGKVTNLNVEERIAFNVSLRMFTRSVVIQRRVEGPSMGC